MFRVYDCITGEHDPGLLALAAAVCIFGWVATTVISRRAVASEQAFIWRGLLGLCGGATVWATHFIAMLAYRTSVPLTYDIGLTTASLVLGIGGMGLGFAVAATGRQRRATRLLGGLCAGVAITVLHYVGMEALRFPGTLSYDTMMVAASIVFSLVFGALGLDVMFAPGRGKSRLGATALLVLMTVSLHFTGMSAATLELGIADPSVASGLSREYLAIAVFVAAIVTLVIGASGALLDQRVSDHLATQAERFKTLANGAFEALVVHDDGLIVDANTAAEEMFGLPDDFKGHSIFELIGDNFDSTVRQLRARGDECQELTLARTDGTTFPGEISRRPIRLVNGCPGELISVRDLTRQKESEARIAHMALHDVMTDLPNRRLFIELAEEARANAARYGGAFAILALDVDNFKLVNDVHGHMAGDDLIREVGARISATLRGGDVLARLGGDEFAIIESSTSQPRHAMVLAQRIIETMQQPIRLADAEIMVSISVGIALYPVDGNAVEDLLRNADTAMYRAKADGKATFCFFEPQMDAALDARRRLEARLRRAITEERLAVHYQPLVNSDSHEPIGFEALVRWHDEELGNIPPADFIPVAEDTGLIIPLGALVLRRACLDAVQWPQSLRVAVNLSVAQFKRSGLVELVGRTLAETGLPGERLELEVTESLLMDDKDDALAILAQLKAFGVRIAMDDFGTGYSSLSYLQSFPFDKIKIDRSFVSKLDDSSESSGIVNAVISMGKSLRMRVVAEGVESGTQADILTRLSCDEMQGYYFARPMSSSDVTEYLNQDSGQQALRRA